MSLLDGLFRDALLQTVMQQDVYLAIRTDNPAGGGAGTLEDPFDASTSVKFDGIMADSVKIPEGTTVHLLPGVYETAGMTAWQPRSRTRIVGSGAATTTLKLLTTSTSGYAVGMNLAGTDLIDFELSDLSIDCGYTDVGGSGSFAAAVQLKGKRIRVFRVHATNFGVYESTSVGVISVAGDNSESCVIEECVVDSPKAIPANEGIINFFQLNGSSGAPHRFCAIRNCYGRGSLSGGFTCVGVVPGIGIGTVIELNAFTTCHVGVSGGSTTLTGQELVIRDNYLWKVSEGIKLEGTSGSGSARVVMTNNVIDVNPVGTQNSAIIVKGSAANKYGEVVARRNTIRRVEGGSGVLNGIQLTNCGDAILENNVINDSTAEEAVKTTTCTAVKFFNNQTSAGELLHGRRDGVRIQELQDGAELILAEI